MKLRKPHENEIVQSLHTTITAACRKRETTEAGTESLSDPFDRPAFQFGAPMQSEPVIAIADSISAMRVL